MKYITAVVRKSRAGEIIHAVEREGIPVLGVSDISVLAEFHDPSCEHISIAYEGTYSLLCKVEIMCADEDEDRLMALLTTRGHTDRPGDGYVLVWSLDRGVRIRTGEEGLEAFRAIHKSG